MGWNIILITLINNSLQIGLDPSLLNKSDCFILDLGKGHDILVYMPQGARRMEKFKATQAANEIRDEDHAGDAKVEIIGEKKKKCWLLNSLTE